MSELLLILTPIALLDAVSMTPLGSVPLLAVLGSKRPLLGSVALLSGIFIPYLAAGTLALFGLASLINHLNGWFDEFLHNPDTLDIYIQLGIGIVMLAFGFKLGEVRENDDDRGAGGDVGLSQCFSIGVALTVVGLPGALPYFAAIDQMLRADLGTAPTLLALLYYNAVCSIPLVLIMASRFALGRRSDAFFQWLADFLSRWAHRLIVGTLVILGFVLTVDAIAWLSGHPLIVFEASPAAQ